MKTILVAGCAALSLGLAQQWIYTRGAAPGSGDNLVALAVDDSGCVYASGHSGGGPVAGTRVTSLMLGPGGDERWVVAYDPYPGHWQRAYDVATGSGLVYVAAGSRDSADTSGYSTICYARDGGRRWARRFAVPGNAGHWTRAIDALPGGGCVITGTSQPTSWMSDYCTVRYDSSGTQKWAKFYSSPGEHLDDANAVLVDEHGFTYVTGEATEPAPHTSAVTIKYDSLGNEVWVSKLSVPGWNSSGYALARDSADNIYVGGMTMNRIMAMKLNPQGETLWTGQSYGGHAVAVAVDRRGNVYVTGTMQYGHWLHDMVLVKFSSTGSRLWEALWRRDSLEDWVYDLAMGPDGSVYICGSTQDRTHGSLAVLAKYDSLGTMRWEATLHGPGVGSANVFNDVEVDRRGDVLVAGAYTTTNTDVDFLVAKYPPSGPGVAERELDRALPGQLPVVTPSLVSRSCRFTVVRLNGTSGIAVSDIVGRTLRVLVVPAGRAGERVSVIWDSRDDAGQPVPNGVYFVTVVGSGIGASSKVVVQR